MFPCSRWIDRQEGEAAVAAIATAVAPGAALPPAKEDAAVGADGPLEGPEGQPGYQIAFHTSRWVCGAIG